MANESNTTFVSLCGKSFNDKTEMLTHQAYCSKCNKVPISVSKGTMIPCYSCEVKITTVQCEDKKYRCGQCAKAFNEGVMFVHEVTDKALDRILETIKGG